ncbi:probable serine/threonine-protein kinase qkgA [Mercenaria mercenaria]|uniref:probable serine/threonine-protein kinase qkgA n=1 Tax=Mercenaria mercenaria TaxID=6596 RepID=UPI00234F993E|nr:probable serine/threonine-protein kinase qkgA [Mercenaria mercenaria]
MLNKTAYQKRLLKVHLNTNRERCPKLLMKDLMSKEAWTETDLGKVYNVMFSAVELNIPLEFRKRYRKEVTKNDTVQRFTEPNEIETKENKTLERNVGDQRFFDKIRKAQERQRKGTLNRNNDSIRAQTAGTDKVPDEIDDDPYTRRLYTKALQDGKETDRGIRINVVGNFSQGKTSLIRRLVGQSIDGVETTNGIDIDRYICKKSPDGNIHCVKSIRDDDTSALRRLFMIANSIESDEVESIGQEAENIGQSSKIDETIYENETEGAELVQSPIYFEINEEFLYFLNLMKSKTRDEVAQTEKELPATFDIWDFGGQYIFYATHTMFHSRNAIYLLVMDLTLGMEHIILDEDFPAETGDRNMEYFIKFWMNSIHSFVGTQNGPEPHVILVGTHKDKIPGDENTKLSCIEKYFENVRMLFDNREVIKHIHSKDFAVDNTSSEDTGIELLGKEIIRLGTEKSTEVQIPAKWIPLEESLKKRKNENIISFYELKKIDAENSFSLDDEEQIKLFLKYHHSKGTLFYFDEEPVSEYVVINPQYLINAFKCIITSERFCKKDPNIRPLWSRWY